jgi:uncharacterized protein (DUF2235 family)
VKSPPANHRRGRQIFYVFGFSRGAYTARALLGMLWMFGLLSVRNEGLIAAEFGEPK